MSWLNLFSKIKLLSVAIVKTDAFERDEGHEVNKLECKLTVFWLPAIWNDAAIRNEIMMEVVEAMQSTVIAIRQFPFDRSNTMNGHYWPHR